MVNQKKELRSTEDVKAILFEFTGIYPSEIEELVYRMNQTDLYVDIILYE